MQIGASTYGTQIYYVFIKHRKGVQTESLESPPQSEDGSVASDNEEQAGAARSSKRLSRRDRDRDEEIRQKIRREIEEELQVTSQDGGAAATTQTTKHQRR